MGRIELLKKIISLYNQLIKLMTIQKEMLADKRKVIYEYAKSCLGQKKAPIYKDYGCAEALNNIVREALGEEIGGGASTYLMYQTLKNSPKFKKMAAPIIGDIIISPSGYGATGKIPNGHVGIISDNGKIMSNNSLTLKWDEYYTLESWKKRYEKTGGYPVDFFQIL